MSRVHTTSLVTVLKEITAVHFLSFPFLWTLNSGVLLVSWLRTDLGNGGTTRWKETGCLGNLVFLPASSGLSV